MENCRCSDFYFLHKRSGIPRHPDHHLCSTRLQRLSLHSDLTSGYLPDRFLSLKLSLIAQHPLPNLHYRKCCILGLILSVEGRPFGSPLDLLEQLFPRLSPSKPGPSPLASCSRTSHPVAHSLPSLLFNENLTSPGKLASSWERSIPYMIYCPPRRLSTLNLLPIQPRLRVYPQAELLAPL